MGDGVYASYRDDMILLTTMSHREDDAEHKIWLEPEVAMALKTYIEQTIKEYGWKK